MRNYRPFTCMNCGETVPRVSATQRVCPSCRPIWRRKRLPGLTADNQNRLSRAECEAILAQLADVREKACKAETDAEADFYTRKYDALNAIVSPYVDGRRVFADGTQADPYLMAMG